MKHVHVHFYDAETAHDPSNGQFTSGAGSAQGPHNDPAMVNIPLSKRGNINAELDKYKAGQAAKAKTEQKAGAAQKKTDKVAAKEMMAEHGPALHARFDAKFGHKALADMLDQMVKWEPAKFIKFVEKHKAETQNG